MKLGNIAVYILCTCLLLTGCGAAEKDAPAPHLGFTLNETRIVMNAQASAVLAALGGPLQYTETASCAFDGVDKTYYYGSFYLATYPAEEGDRIHSLWFADDTVSTEEGIRIGSTWQEVVDIYGADTLLENGTCVYADANTVLTICFEGQTVSSILYEAILE